MAIFLKISKYAAKLFSLLLVSLILLLVSFLYKPSYFLSNIENYLSSSFESYLLDVDVSIENIEGNFFSGFNIGSVNIFDGESASLVIKNINIQPSLKDILYGNIIFKSVKVKSLGVSNLSNIVLNDKFISNNNFLIPDIIVKEIDIQSGSINYNELKALFSGKLDIAFGNDESIIDIENFNITLNEKKYHLNNGLINIKDQNIIFKDFLISNENNLIGSLNIDFNLFPFHISSSNILLNDLELPIYDDIYISDIRFLATKENTLDYDLSINLDIGKDREYIDVFGYYENGLVFFNLKNQKLLNNIFNVEGNYNISNNNGGLNIYSNPQNAMILNGGLDFNINDKLDFSSVININRFLYRKLDFERISGELLYKDNEIVLLNTLLVNPYNIQFNIKDALFSSIDKFLLSGNIVGEEINLNLLNDWFGADFSDYTSKGTNLDYQYKKNLHQSNLLVKGSSDELAVNQAYFEDVKYELSYSNKIDNCFASAKSLVFNNHSLDSISFKYVDGLIDLHSNNSNSGQFLSFNSRISDSNILIEELDARINNVDIYGESISLLNTGGHYVSDNIDLLIGEGIFHGSINFKNIKDFWGSSSIDDISLASIDKLLFLNNRYDGYLTGDFDFSTKNSIWYINTNLSVDDFKFDELEYSELIFSGLYQNDKLTINHLLGQNDFSIFELYGSLNMNHRFALSKYTHIDLKGNVQNFDLSKLNRYIPWTIDVKGEMSSDILVSGTLDNIRFNLNPTIINPVFDKIEGVEAFGKVSYKNNRLYFSNVTCQTALGRYDINGSLPANLNYFNSQELDSKPIYIDIVGASKSLELLMPYFSFIKDIKGDFDYTLNIHGNYNNTIRDGQITIRNGYVDVLQLDNRISNINAYAVINNNRLIINNFDAELSEPVGSEDLIDGIALTVKEVFDYNDANIGSIGVVGSINLESFFNPDLSLNIVGRNNYLSSSYGQFEGVGDSDFAITGRDTILISGEFSPRFNEFIVFDVENRDDNNEINEITDSKFVAYDIYIPFPNGIRIKSDNINLLLEGEMNLSSFSNDDIAISGKANIIDGNFFYNGNEFYSTQGTILVDPISSSPYIEVHSMTDVYDDNISVSFIGYTDNPNLILESTISNYSQSDILQLLTFKDKNLDQSISQPFGNVITNYLETQLEKNVTLYTDLDEFRLQHSGSLMQGFGDADISVFMGKRISNRLYLNTKINLNDNTFNEYEMSYRLNSNSSIVAKIDDNRYWKLNYRFKYKY